MPSIPANQNYLHNPGNVVAGQGRDKCQYSKVLHSCFPEHKLCLVGLDNAGKTTILYQFLMNEVVHTSPTIGSNVEEVVWNNLHFIMWDLGGQESLRTAWNTYYSNTEFILLVVDSTDRERLTITKEELHRMLQSDELCKASVLVFANKQVGTFEIFLILISDYKCSQPSYEWGFIS